jgi:autotransporter-associated beta strand protein
LFVAAILAQSVSARAATYFWDPGPPYQSGGYDGSGAWDQATENWYSSGGTEYANGQTNIVNIGTNSNSAAQIITMGGPIVAGTIMFNGGDTAGAGYTIAPASGMSASLSDTLEIYSGGIALISSGGPTTITAPVVLGASQDWTNNSNSLLIVGSSAPSGTISLGSNTLTVEGNGNTTIAGAISGAGATALTMSGTGTLTLSGANTYTGTTTLTSGTLQATTSAQALGAGAASLSLGGGALDLANASGTNLSFNRNTTVTASAQITSDLTSGSAGNTYTLGTLAIGAETLTIAGGASLASGIAGISFGTTTLSTTGTTFTINNPVGGGSTLLTLESVTSSGSDSFIVNGSGNATIGSVTTGSANVTMAGAGTLILSGGNTYSGTTTVDSGTVSLMGSLSSSSKLTVAGGTFTASVAATVAGLTANAAASAVNETTGADTLTLAAITRNTGATVAFNASGSTGKITYSTITGGGTNQLTNGLLGNGGGWATYGFGSTMQYATTTGTSSPYTISAYSGAMPETGVSAGFSGGTSNYSLSGTGTMTAGGNLLANTLQYTGAAQLLSLNSKTLEVNGLMNSGSGLLTISGGGTTGVEPASSSIGEIAFTGSEPISISSAIGNNTVATAVTANLTGATLTLSGTNTYTGPTYVGGTLSISSNANLGLQSSAATLNLDNGTLQATGGSSFGLYMSAGTDNRAVVLGPGGGTFDIASGTTLSVAGAISDSTVGIGGLTKIDTGTLVLGGSDSYTGPTTINGGTLSLATGGSLSSSSALVTGGSGGTFTASVGATVNGLIVNAGAPSVDETTTGDTVTLGAITRNLGTVVNFQNYASPVGTIKTTSTGNVTSTGIIGPWAFFGSGTSLKYATLTGSTSPYPIAAYSSGTAAGTNLASMTATGANYTDASSAGEILGAGATGNTLQYTGSGETISLGNNALTLNGLLNSGSGTLTISGDGGVIAGTNTSIANELVLNAGSGAITVASPITNNQTNASTLTVTGAGTVTFTGANTYTGGTYIAAGVLQLGNGATNGTLSTTGAVFIAGGGTLAFDPTISTTLVQGTNFGSLISGTGSVQQNGAGTLNLTVANTYSGGTAVNAGTLVASNTSGSATGAGIVVVGGGSLPAATATLAGTGIISGLVTINGSAGGGAAGHLAPGSSGAGTITLGGGLTLNSGANLDYTLGTNSTLANLNTGTLSLGQNITLNVTQGGGFAAGTNYTLISSTGPTINSGNFSGWSATGVNGDTPTFSIVGDNLDVSFDVTSTSVSLTNPQGASVIRGGTATLSITLNNTGSNTLSGGAYSLTAADGGSTNINFGSASPSTSATSINAGSGNNSQTFTFSPTTSTSSALGVDPVTFTVPVSTGVSTQATASTTLTVYNHSAAQFNVVSGNNQNVIVGAGGITAGLTLDNTTATTGVSTPAPLDVNSLSSGLSGPNGTAAIGSNSSGSYTATLNTSAAGVGQQQSFSLNAGDSQSITGANPLAGLSQSVTLNVYNHAIAGYNVVSGSQDFGAVHQGASVSPLVFDLTDTGSTLAGLQVSAVSQSGSNSTLSGGSSFPFVVPNNSTSASYSATIGTGTVGTYSALYTFTTGDDPSIAGHNVPSPNLAVTITGGIYSGQMIWSGASGGSWGTGMNWTDSVSGGARAAPGVDPNFPVSDAAFFGNSSGSVIVNLNAATPSLAGITFNGAGSFTIAPGSGGSLTLAGSSPTITALGTQAISAPLILASSTAITVTNVADSLTIAGNISGTGTGLTLTSGSAGTLTLSGSDNYTGGTTVNGGTLNLNSAPGTGALAINTAGASSIVNVNTAVAIGSLSGTVGGGGTAQLNVGPSGSATLTINQTASAAFAGTLALGSGSGLAVNAVNNSSVNQTLTISGAPTFAGGNSVTIGAGTLEFTNGTAATISGSVTIMVASGATLQLAGSADALSGAANITMRGTASAGDGALSLTGVTTQTVGIVSGVPLSTMPEVTTYSGNTIVGDGMSAANLTASQILQNTLTIAAGSTVTILPSGAGVLGSSIAAASSTIDVASSTPSAGSTGNSASSDSSSDSSGDSSGDPFAAIQAAIASGSISAAAGQRLENRISAIEQLAAENPGLNVSLLESRVLASLPLSSPSSASGSSTLWSVAADSGLLATDSSMLAAASGSASDGAVVFSSMPDIGNSPAVPEPSTLLLAVLAGIGLWPLAVQSLQSLRHKDIKDCRATRFIG